MKAIFTVGVSASGKSYWAETQDMVNINRDEVRRKLLLETTDYQIEDNMWRYYKFTKVNETIVTERCNIARYEAILAGKDIIFSNTNLNPYYLKQDIAYMESKGYEVEIKSFPVDYDTAIKRDKQRVSSVGETVINKQWFDWLKLDYEYTRIKKYVKDKTKPPAIICDIDGTVAAHYNRGPFDWDKVLTDEPIEEIVDLVNRYEYSHEIIFLSGRDSICRDKTLEWLKRYFKLEQYQLLMRPNNSSIKDRIVKEQLFWENVAPNYRVDLVIDDRKQVIRLWTDMSSTKNSFKVINVGNYYEDF